MRASVVKTADAFLYAGAGAGICPAGILKSLRSSDHKTGAPSRAQKVQFKHPINPSNILQAEIRVIPAFFIGR